MSEPTPAAPMPCPRCNGLGHTGSAYTLETRGYKEDREKMRASEDMRATCWQCGGTGIAANRAPAGEDAERALKLAATRFDLLAGRFRGCIAAEGHVLSIEEAEMFAAEARASAEMTRCAVHPRPQPAADARTLPLAEREALSKAATEAARQFNREPGNFLKIAQAAIYAYQAAATAGLTDAAQPSERADRAEATLREIYQIAISRKTVPVGGKKAAYEAELSTIADLSRSKP